MASDQPGTKESTAKPEEEPTTAGTIRGFITEEIKRLLPTVGKTDAPAVSTKDTKAEADPSTITQQVQAALQALQRKEERELRDKEVDDFLAEARKEKEKPPVERRRVEKLMGWGE